MLTWDYYKKIRKVDLSNFIKRRDIKTYDDLVQTLEKLDVSSPSIQIFQNAYIKVYPPKEDKPILEETPLPPKVEQKVTSDEDISVVQAPVVPLKKKRPYRRRKPRKKE
jgi:hypothetical protein